jgi:hypothetical protein
MKLNPNEPSDDMQLNLHAIAVYLQKHLSLKAVHIIIFKIIQC